MLELIPSGLRIDFIGKTKGFVIASLVVILLGVGSVVLHGGLKQGIDFSGGTLLHLGFGQDVELRVVRDALAPVGLEQSIVQHFGGNDEVLIRVAQSNEDMSYVASQLQDALQQRLPEQAVEILRVEVVGPQVSADLRRKALFAAVLRRPGHRDLSVRPLRGQVAHLPGTGGDDLRRDLPHHAMAAQHLAYGPDRGRPGSHHRVQPPAAAALRSSGPGGRVSRRARHRGPAVHLQPGNSTCRWWRRC